MKNGEIMNSQEAGHKQVDVYNPIFKKNIRVDEGIAELMALVWGLGLGTESSCQEMKKLSDGTLGPYIGFLTVSDAELFMNIVLEYLPDKKESDTTVHLSKDYREGL